MDTAAKIRELRMRLEKWKKDKAISWEEFKSNQTLQDAILHNMLVAIQSVIDLGNSIIEKKQLESPATYAEIFEILSRHDLINKSLSKKLVSLAKFRNVLVHLYWKIDLKRVYRIFKTSDKTLEEFLKIAEKLLG